MDVERIIFDDSIKYGAHRRYVIANAAFIKAALRDAVARDDVETFEKWIRRIYYYAYLHVFDHDLMMMIGNSPMAKRFIGVMFHVVNAKAIDIILDVIRGDDLSDRQDEDLSNTGVIITAMIIGNREIMMRRQGITIMTMASTMRMKIFSLDRDLIISYVTREALIETMNGMYPVSAGYFIRKIIANGDGKMIDYYATGEDVRELVIRAIDSSKFPIKMAMMIGCMYLHMRRVPVGHAISSKLASHSHFIDGIILTGRRGVNGIVCRNVAMRMATCSATRRALRSVPLTGDGFVSILDAQRAADDIRKVIIRALLFADVTITTIADCL